MVVVVVVGVFLFFVLFCYLFLPQMSVTDFESERPLLLLEAQV